MGYRWKYDNLSEIKFRNDWKKTTQIMRQRPSCPARKAALPRRTEAVLPPLYGDALSIVKIKLFIAVTIPYELRVSIFLVRVHSVNLVNRDTWSTTYIHQVL